MPDFPDTYEFSNNFALPKPTRASEASAATSVGKLSDRLDAVLTKGIRSSGVKFTDASQSTTSASYTLLGTHDEVTGIVVPSGGGILGVVFNAAVNLVSNNGDTGYAAVFVGSSQITDGGAIIAGTPAIQTVPGGAGIAPHSGDPAPGILTFPVVAGTYDVSVRFKTVGGISLAVSGRKLFVIGIGAGLPS